MLLGPSCGTTSTCNFKRHPCTVVQHKELSSQHPLEQCSDVALVEGNQYNFLRTWLQRSWQLLKSELAAIPGASLYG